jgi:phosphoribosylamine--glycine ligase
LLAVMEACLDGRLAEVELEFADNAAVCVVLASQGYPEAYEKGLPISGLERFEGNNGCYCFHAGTAIKDGAIVTNGGRVLGVTALGATLAEARAKAYQASEWVQFDGKYLRSDIGKAIQ